MLLQEMFATPLPNIHLVDGGARYIHPLRYQALLDQNLCTISGFEPDLAACEQLRGQFGPPHRFYPFALGQGGAATLYQTRYPGCSSLRPPNPEVINQFSGIGTEAQVGNFEVVATHAITTSRLDEIPPPEPVDYLKLDVQGCALEVLTHAKQTLANVGVIECEVEFVPLYQGQALFGEIQQFLATQGFMLHKLLDIGGRNFRPIALGNPCQAMSQVLWADAIFIRDFTRFDSLSPSQLLKLALVLNDVYHSYDCVMKLLSHYDIQQNCSMASNYIAKLQQLSSLPLKYMNLQQRVDSLATS